MALEHSLTISETNAPSTDRDVGHSHGDGSYGFVRDDSYYLADVIFLVEGCLFKVPRQYFEDDSEVFRTMFQLPVSEGATPDGLCDQQPLRLDGITKGDFRALLRVMYPTKFQKDEVLTIEEWTSVLKLSTMWDLDAIRKLCIRTMATLVVDVVDKVVLARDYHVDDWLVPALNCLVQRKEPLGVEDAQRLGIDYALKIAAIREGVRVYESRMYVGDRGALNLDFTAKIRKVFVL